MFEREFGENLEEINLQHHQNEILLLRRNNKMEK